LEKIMAKSAVFGVMHLAIAFAVGFALTGSFALAGAFVLVEPVANTVAHYFFDRWWDRPSAAAWRARLAERLRRARSVWPALAASRHRRLWLPET
jgi:uncharacterized membrane protein